MKAFTEIFLTGQTRELNICQCRRSLQQRKKITKAQFFFQFNHGMKFCISNFSLIITFKIYFLSPRALLINSVIREEMPKYCF